MLDKWSSEIGPQSFQSDYLALADDHVVSVTLIFLEHIEKDLDIW